MAWRWLSYRPCPDNCSVFAMEGGGGGGGRGHEGGGGRWLSVLVGRGGKEGVVGMFYGCFASERCRTEEFYPPFVYRSMILRPLFAPYWPASGDDFLPSVRNEFWERMSLGRYFVVGGRVG